MTRKLQSALDKIVAGGGVVERCKQDFGGFPVWCLTQGREPRFNVQTVNSLVRLGKLELFDERVNAAGVEYFWRAKVRQERKPR